MDREITAALKEVAGQDAVLENEMMKLHTTFHVGGPADLFVMPRSSDALSRVIRLCQDAKIPWYIIGNGSNLLVSDEGFRGAIIQLAKNFSSLTVNEPEGTMEGSAGVTLAAAARQAAQHSLTGLEFASGIPGTLGGAMMMNAGAYGGEMKDVTVECRVLTRDGQEQTFSGDQMQFGYRTSRIDKEGGIVISARLHLQKGNQEEIYATMEQLRRKRLEKQPLQYPSAGSTFKRPEGHFAGKLIEEAGLRGFRVGDAMVSEKHCGFVINAGSATAAQIDSLIRQVQERVYENAGVRLEPEVRRVGF